MVAVFDGHNGAEASEMASKHMFKYFMLHPYFLGRELEARDFRFLNWGEDSRLQEVDRERVRTLNFYHSYHLDILKEALLRAIQDIDAKFSKEASRDDLNSGCTATVVLMADGKVLDANVGDSKVSHML
ncbi:hypothetical protein CDL15_Pgr017691 [Punica granatum]|uniref:PPM-type phosphatase domain-containing protein n=1 Tax=Punica granatum TaxID=22663 RepID=A0A218WWE5_PUNGR|nr:hypothetical protein CDL15_Pgr017691 [Punica granatum]